MANSKKNKIKLVKLHEMLRTETDSAHPLTTQDIVRKLEDLNISCDRRTLSSDIAELNSVGFNIQECKVGKQKAYYIDDTSLSIPELKILIDAVQAASFIPEDKSEAMIEKISALGGIHRSEVLRGNRVAFNTRKHNNAYILTAVELINRAISEHKKISFLYFDLNENKSRIYRKNRKRYKESPAALVFNDDNYYVVCYSSKHKKQLNYRIDRMDAVRIEEDAAAQESIMLADNLTEYTKQAFRMFSGEPKKVTLQFDRSIIGQIYDQFGEDIEVKELSDDVLQVSTEVQVSPTFIGWLTQYGEKLKVVQPTSVKKEMLNTIENLEKTYADD